MIHLLHRAVERSAERDPDRDAFRVPGRGFSYAELDDKANRLAHLLIDEGVRRGDRVGIFAPRCLESPLAVFGILKAGAAFVPLDPHVPAAALRRLIEDGGIRHLVAHGTTLRTLAAMLEEGGTGLACVVGIEPSKLEGPSKPEGMGVRPWSDLDAYPGDRSPDVRILGEDLAYIMYSSGSTGRPKGIMHTHSSGLAYARLSVKTYDVVADDRIGNHSPLHFDMSTFGYFSSPLAGATTVLIPEAYTKMAASLSQLMEKERLTIWYSVPLALIQLLGRGVLESRDLDSLRWVLFGGEPFARRHLYALMAAWPRARFSNVYGPAEVNQCTYFHVPRPEDPAAAAEDPVLSAPSLPIGRIWDDTEGLVLDTDDHPVQPGEEGELVIRSATRMQGYWARPELNARAFYHPQGEGGFAKVFYRTGDRVRQAANGELLFLGRMDRQLKVRGHRLDPDDLENTLMAHGSVEEAAVFPVSNIEGGTEDGTLHLEAEVSAAPGRQLDLEVLRGYLAERVSTYAMPSEIREVASFPRTTSGKIDRRLLRRKAEERLAPASTSPRSGESDPRQLSSGLTVEGAQKE